MFLWWLFSLTHFYFNNYNLGLGTTSLLHFLEKNHSFCSWACFGSQRENQGAVHPIVKGTWEPGRMRRKLVETVPTFPPAIWDPRIKRKYRLQGNSGGPKLGFHYIIPLPGVFLRDRASCGYWEASLGGFQPSTLSFHLHQEKIQGNVNNAYFSLKISVNIS